MKVRRMGGIGVPAVAAIPVRILSAILLFALACDSGTEPGPAVDQVTVEPEAFVLEVGETLDLAATPHDASGAALGGLTVVWTASDDDVATVSPAGRVTAVGEGPVTVTATVGGRSGTSAGTVEPNTTVTSAGRTLTSADGKVTLVFPPGAVSESVRIGIEPSSGLPAEPRVVPGSSYHLTPSGLQFAAPVQLTIRYGDLPSALAEDAPYLWLHRYTDGAWTPVTAGASVDTIAGTVTVELTGFSDYAAVVSELAADLQELNVTLNRLLGDPVALDAVRLMELVAGLLAQVNHPLFQAMIDPVLESMILTACGARDNAVSIAQGTTISTYQMLDAQLRPVYYWTAVLVRLDSDERCPPPISPEALHVQKFAEFVQFFIDRLSPGQIEGSYEELLKEVDLLMRLRGDGQLLDLPHLDDLLLTGAQHPLLNQLRISAYAACRNDGVHRYLGHLREQVLLVDEVQYTEDDVLDDLQYCATRLTWTLEDGDGEEVGSGQLGGGDAPGALTKEATSPGTDSGTLTFGGDVSAFRCTDGGFAPDEFVITLAGTEVDRRGTGAGGALFDSPLELDMETILSAAGIDPAETDTHRLQMARVTSGCGAPYVSSFEPVMLAAIDLSYPAEWSYEEDFNSGSPGPEWSSSIIEVSPSGERFLGQFKDQDVYLTFESLGDHSEVTLELDLYVIDSWDGWDPSDDNASDRVTIAVVGGATLLDTSFSNDDGDQQNFPDMWGAGLNPPGTGASAIEALGYPREGDSWGDTTYSLSYTFPHTSGTLKIFFRSNTTGEDETIGLDNVRVRVR